MAHFLLVTLPAQGHINPTLQFAKQLARAAGGSRVTFATSVSAYRCISKYPGPDAVSYAAFSDGYDEGFKPTDDRGHYMAQLKQTGARTLSALVRALADEGRPVTCVVYTIILGWVADLARDLGLPSALLWIQPATVFSVYYHYFHGYDTLIKSIDKTSITSSIKLPNLPLLTPNEVPSFLLPSDPHNYVLPAFREQFEALDREDKPRVLVNTFKKLEPEALKSIQGVNLIGVGPLLPSALLDGNDASDMAFGGDLFSESRDCMEWLESQRAKSVVYVSFGSIIAPSKRQMEEIAKGLLESSRPFLWVLRLPEDGENNEFDAEFRRQLAASEGGLVVPWCTQVEVLSHPSVGCFVTHCGWNSTLESLAAGVPTLCFPQWTDQGTNAKMVEDVWRTGLRMKANEEGILESEELKRCLEQVMGGEQGEETRENAKNWMDLAREAAKKGGSSYKNIQAFVEEVKGHSLS